eukprot:GILI01024271.1.p1 GENE.GILI01024271.1~~GILI01024271.1.p1  ORF type:complete len:299 (+),score=91.39 GILI01024271.1:63-899(+)
MGWPWCFYLFGLVGILWVFVFHFYSSSTPDQHPRISQQEKAYIRQEVPAATGAVNSVPLSAILVSPATWAIALAWFCNNWGWYTWLSWQPTFYKHQGLHEDHASWFSALPYVCLLPMVVIAGSLSDYFVRQGHSIAFVRKAFNTIGMVGPSICYLVLQTISTPAAALVVICIAFAFNAFAICAFGVNPLDIGGSVVGTVTGFGNTFGCLAGIIVNLFTGFLIQETGDWQIVLTTMSVVYLIGTVSFILLARGTPQFEHLVNKEGSESTSSQTPSSSFQ